MTFAWKSRPSRIPPNRLITARKLSFSLSLLNQAQFRQVGLRGRQGRREGPIDRKFLHRFLPEVHEDREGRSWRLPVPGRAISVCRRSLPYPRHQISLETHEPGVTPVVGRAGLAATRPAQRFARRSRAGPHRAGCSPWSLRSRVVARREPRGVSPPECCPRCRDSRDQHGVMRKPSLAIVPKAATISSRVASPAPIAMGRQAVARP